MTRPLTHRPIGATRQSRLISLARGVTLTIALLGCATPEQQDKNGNAGAFVTHLIRLIATRKLVDQPGAERWKPGPDQRACVAFLSDNDDFLSSAVQYCQRGGADFAVGLEEGPCISADLLQDVFHHYGWTFSREIRLTMTHGDIEPGPAINGHVTMELVSRPVPMFDAIGELYGMGSLKFEFRQPGKDCATDVLARQLL
jgi:hypothetical protein